MYLDAELEFSDAQALTADAVSTNVIDGGSLEKRFGEGNPVFLVVQVQTTLVSAGNTATLTTSLQTSVDEAFTSPITMITGAVEVEADLVAGFRILGVALPHGAKRFLRLNYDNGTEVFTAGAVDAFIVKDVQTWFAIADALGPVHP